MRLWTKTFFISLLKYRGNIFPESRVLSWIISRVQLCLQDNKCINWKLNLLLHFARTFFYCLELVSIWENLLIDRHFTIPCRWYLESRRNWYAHTYIHDITEFMLTNQYMLGLFVHNNYIKKMGNLWFRSKTKAQVYWFLNKCR